MEQAVRQGTFDVVVQRISEQIQPDAEILRDLSDAGARPGSTVRLQAGTDGLHVSSDAGSTVVDGLVARHVFVTVA